MKRHEGYVDEYARYHEIMNEFAHIKFDKKGKNQPANLGFRCVHCHREVPADNFYSHVQNRNHCPYCLWSRHLDLYQAGDRLCACKGAMRPVALTTKQRRKKYAHEGSGELMLVHQCQDCGRVSLNRIAADDRIDLILDIYHASFRLPSDLSEQLIKEGIRTLSNDDATIVHARLPGVSFLESSQGNQLYESAFTA
jgi:hypothetical protein